MHILLLSYAFPPVAAAEAYVAAKEIAGLKEKNIKIDVIALSPKVSAMTEDISIDTYISRFYQNIWRVGLPGWFLKLMRWIPRVCTVLCQFPDKFIFANQEVLHLLKEIDLAYYDLVITRSQWHSMHLVGCWLKEKHPGLLWVAHFSDPWVDNPLAWHFSIIDWFCKKWEKRVVELADKITVTTPETIDLMFQKYPTKYRKKAVCIPHSYDEELYDKNIQRSFDKYIIRCLGGFYGARSPRPFFCAVNRIAKEDPRALKDVCIEFYGIHGRHRKCLDEYIYASQYITLFDNVTYQESLYLMQGAHCLLSIEAPLNNSVFFPSKLVDYMGAGAHIFSISPQGAATNILNEVGATVADIHKRDEIYSKLVYILKTKPIGLNNNIKEYSNRIVGEKIMKMIVSLCEE